MAILQRGNFGESWAKDHIGDWRELLERAKRTDEYIHVYMERMVQHPDMDEPTKAAHMEAITKANLLAKECNERLAQMNQVFIDVDDEWRRQNVMAVIVNVMDLTGSEENFPMALVVEECVAKYGFKAHKVLSIIDELTKRGRLSMKVN